ncbi:MULTISPECIES: DUF6286 domain-containing protein [Streptomyces]|uniref:Membrane protein n=1 Tax=Streptomyces viridochromogenes TaxID=1938 RepID=A0A0L8JVF0_STRVR|nr:MULTISPECIES: DUF6286 domain-containing protein [Streptomyces]KOG17623.1 membrane protein [Streptomyces viridochromogenes]
MTTTPQPPPADDSRPTNPASPDAGAPGPARTGSAGQGSAPGTPGPGGPAPGAPDPGDAGPGAPGPVPVLADAPAAPVRRFWAVRRIPAALLAAVVLGGTGLLLYDVAAVRADHSAMAWRRELADALATRPLDSTGVVIGAAVAVVLGIWLLLLAATPGLRSVLPMRREHADVRAGLDREAAALTLRDRAMEVSGVQSVHVRVRRSKATVRAVSHFRALDEVRADVEQALATGVDELGLAHPPALTVRVARPPKKG